MGLFDFLRPKPVQTVPDDFDRLFNWLMEWEGRAFENDPQDPGGCTKFGIDQRSHPHVNIRELTEEQAKAIYLQEWDADGCKDLNRPIAEVYFNFAVNCGKGRAAEFLSAATVAAVKGGQYTSSTIALGMIAEADAFYKRLGQRMPKFVRGWLNRDASLRKFIS